MLFEGREIPGACWVEIVQITNKDGSPLAQDNWRRKLFGMITICWIAGGFQYRGAFFKADLRMKDGEVTKVDLDSVRWTSSTEEQPVKIEPDIYDLETNTSVYRFRILSDEEEIKVNEAVRKTFFQQLQKEFLTNEPPTNGMPVS